MPDDPYSPKDESPVHALFVCEECGHVQPGLLTETVIEAIAAEIDRQIRLKRRDELSKALDAARAALAAAEKEAERWP